MAQIEVYVSHPNPGRALARQRQNSQPFYRGRTLSDVRRPPQDWMSEAIDEMKGNAVAANMPASFSGFGDLGYDATPSSRVLSYLSTVNAKYSGMFGAGMNFLDHSAMQYPSEAEMSAASREAVSSKATGRGLANLSPDAIVTYAAKFFHIAVTKGLSYQDGNPIRKEWNEAAKQYLTAVTRIDGSNATNNMAGGAIPYLGLGDAASDRAMKLESISTGGGSTKDEVAVVSSAPSSTNWLLWGGIAVAAVGAGFLGYRWYRSRGR